MDLCVENDEEYVPWANSVKNFQIDKKWIRQKKKLMTVEEKIRCKICD